MSADVPPEIFRPSRLQAVAETGLIGTARSEAFDRLVELAAKLTGAPLAFFTLVDGERSWYHSSVGVPDDVDSGPVEASFCKYVIGSDRELVVGDAASDPRTIGNPALEGMGVAAWAGHPVRSASGEVLGTFCVVDTAPRTWSERDVELLAVLAAATADEVAFHVSRQREEQARTVADRAQHELEEAHAREHELIELMRRTLLPERSSAVGGLSLALRYAPHSPTVLGGDWYDLIDLPDGSLVLVVADVSGHDLEAVAVMAQLRHFLHVYARERREPDAVLAALHQLMQELRMERFCTVFYGRWDPATSTLRHLSAGHPPPVLVPSEGGPRLVESGRTLMLGIAGTSVDARPHDLRLAPGDILAVFTDGLFERPGRDIDDGLAHIMAVLDGQRGARTADEVADALMTQLRPRREWHDDVALLVAIAS